MKKWLLWIIITALLSASVHIAFVTFIPKIIMAVLMERGTQDRELNRMYHPPRIDSNARKIVSPSPDLAYSICFYDLTEGPLQITTPKSEFNRYMSVALYDDNTNNFFVQNDRALPAEGLKIIVHTANQISSNSNTVTSSSNTGLVLVRRTFDGDAEWRQVDAERQMAYCRTR